MNSYTEERLREALGAEADQLFAADVAKWKLNGARSVDAFSRSLTLTTDKAGNTTGEVKYFFTLANGKPWTPHARLEYRSARGQERESWYLAYASWQNN